MIVVSDTSPLNYLILTQHVDLMPRILGDIVTTSAVLEELRDPAAPARVREWTLRAPGWLRVVDPRQVDESLGLGRGEQSAISLALELAARGDRVRVLIDESAGRAIARSRGLRVMGTLAVLVEAADMGAIDLAMAFRSLQQTSFHAAPELFEEALRLHRQRRGNP